MWERSYEKEITGVSREAIWRVWSDIDHWHEWNPGIKQTTLKGNFAVGSVFTLQPLKGPKVEIALIEIEEGISFTDCTTFPGAKMHGSHKIISEKDGGLRLVTTIQVTGFLGFLWRKIVAQGIVDKMPEQTAQLIELARSKG